MAVQCSSRTARPWGLGVAAVALALLGGCVAVPVEPYQVGDPVAYPATVYGDGYYAPGYSTYAAPYYYGPPLSVGVYGWSGGRYWRNPPPPRPGWSAPPPGPRPGVKPPSPPRPPSGGVRPTPGGWDNPRPAPPPRPSNGGAGRPNPGGWDNPLPSR
ncbi:hypothetical protein [Ottowia sp.]|uniref:hypothetical protein n=1 Tax=Ottowia sp. TaxID=1898956 RepID=UPI0039E4D85C